MVDKFFSKKSVERVAQAPAYILDKTVTSSQKIGELTVNRPARNAKKYWQSLGPGLTTGAADDDPSGIATYSQVGARYGFQLAWLALFTFPLMSVVQEMCARIGLVTGRGLSANIRRHFPPWALYLCTILLLGANTFNIGADLGAMASASRLLFPQLNFILLLVFFTFISIALQVFTSYEKYAKYLKWMALILISYVLSAFTIKLDFNSLLQSTFIPSITFSREQLFLICAVLGTTISPYLFFWQTSQEVEEEILKGKTTIAQRAASTTPAQVKRMRRDVWSGMFVSNIVMFFIIAACGATLYANGIFNIQTSADAAQALRPIAGDYAYLLFTLGIIGTGMLAVPILAGSSAYAISEALEWKFGLHQKLNDAYSFYGVIIFSMIVGLFLNLLGIDPIPMLIYSAVANGLIAPLILLFIVLISSDKKIMGQWVNPKLITAIGYVTIFIMGVAGIATILSFF
ncbi:MAG: divalent metal cation transporter [Candidatus Levybacteria bacterium]|nr:divalent metal cation transporter [Candidatus Levybacteria bacterium]MBP9815238.1 divalent metal cation transporter [Candidatus Levybacteria bacterium]